MPSTLRPSGLIALCCLQWMSACLPMYPLDTDGRESLELGEYRVQVFTYGSGTDRRRFAYREGVSLRSQTVDLSKVLTLSAGRAAYWGFSADAVPLNAYVYMPIGAGPFPLVLIAHGSHSMLDESERGYEYLGKTLASHGFIVASLDMNFINPVGYGRPSGSMKARVELFTSHLEQWTRFNTSQDSPVSGKVDMDRVGLIGHSRGGEAAMVAAWHSEIGVDFARRYSGYEHPHRVVSVVALAPTDRSYNPGEPPITLDETSYLTIQGSHDADLTTFQGLRAYHRARLGYYHSVKAAVFVDRANHGQWNSVWGVRDRGTFSDFYIRTEELISQSQQQAVGAALIYRFMDGTMRGHKDSLKVFHDVAARERVLPSVGMITRFQQGGFIPLVTFAPGKTAKGVSKGVRKGVSVAMTGDGVRRDRPIRFRDRRYTDPHDAVAEIWWRDDTDVTIIVAPGVLARRPLSRSSTVEFALMPLSPTRHRSWRVQIVDADGDAAEVAIHPYGTVQAPWRVQLFRDDRAEQERFWRDHDRILQGFSIPMTAFIDANPAVDASELRKIVIQLRGATRQGILLDSIGVTP